MSKEVWRFFEGHTVRSTGLVKSPGRDTADAGQLQVSQLCWPKRQTSEWGNYPGHFSPRGCTVEKQSGPQLCLQSLPVIWATSLCCILLKFLMHQNHEMIQWLLFHITNFWGSMQPHVTRSPAETTQLLSSFPSSMLLSTSLFFLPRSLWYVICIRIIISALLDDCT